jgi:hypothetical protein
MIGHSSVARLSHLRQVPDLLHTSVVRVDRVFARVALARECPLCHALAGQVGIFQAVVGGEGRTKASRSSTRTVEELLPFIILSPLALERQEGRRRSGGGRSMSKGGPRPLGHPVQSVSRDYRNPEISCVPRESRF